MIKGLFLVFLLLAVASTKAAVDQKGEKKLNIIPKKVLTIHYLHPFIMLDFCEDESEDFNNIKCPIQRGDYNGCCLCTQVRRYYRLY